VVNEPPYVHHRVWSSLVLSKQALSDLLHGQLTLSLFRIVAAEQSLLLPFVMFDQLINNLVTELIRRKFLEQFDVLLDYLGFADEQLTINHYFKYSGFCPQTGWTVIDIGANVGEYAIPAARMIREGKVVAVEPEPNNYSKLLQNIRINNLTNIISVKVAIGAKEGWFPINRLPGLCQETPTKIDTNNVRVTTIDALISELCIPNVDIIKIDIEGWEWLALQGCVDTIRRFHPRLIVECHNGCLAEQVRAFLLRNGYEVWLWPVDHYLYNYEITCYASGKQTLR
jgi:FkbM family methyltransferase